MAVSDIVPVGGARFEETLASASPDVLREMIRGFAQAMMDAEVGQACGAGYGEVSPDRVNSRNGYRRRERDTRAGTVELAIPRLRQGSYYPEWLLERRRRAERALATVVATSYLLGVSTRRVEKLAESLGVTRLSKSQVSVMAAELDEMVAGFRSRPLDAGPYTFAWIDALTQKVREGGRTVNVHALIATGVNADGKREILGLDVASSEDGAGWLAFLRGLAARGLAVVVPVPLDGTPAHEIGNRLREALRNVTDREWGDGVTAARRTVECWTTFTGPWLTEKSIVTTKLTQRTLDQRLALLRHALPVPRRCSSRRPGRPTLRPTFIDSMPGSLSAETPARPSCSSAAALLERRSLGPHLAGDKVGAGPGH